jgi:indole-3-glycerol phosphate synthase
MSVLKQICVDKMDYVERNQHLIPEIVFQERARQQEAPRGFCAAIDEKKKKKEPALIAEIKKASPSKGIIRTNFDPARLAKVYENAEATCLSVLTDQPYFKGSDEDFEAARRIVNLPMLRKDFMLTPYQITESRAIGADCILLIMAALDDETARILSEKATELNMDILYEVHDMTELERAMNLFPRMIGVNSRNLKTLEVNLQTAYDLVKEIPASVIKVAESGIAGNAELKALHKAGYDAFLVGESLMREDDVGQAVQNLLGK